MYNSDCKPIFIDGKVKNERTEIVSRLYGMGFNLCPMNGKKPCIPWKPFQTQRVTPEKIKEWMPGRFPTKDGKSFWKPEILNFALLTGAIPWSEENPGIVVIDCDDDEAEALVQQCCPDTPMTQRTGSGGVHRVYRRPPVEASPYIGNRQKTWNNGKQFNVDVRGDGGYIMCPGSIHPKSEQLYREDKPWTLELLMQCPVYDPTWLPCEHAGKTQRTQKTEPVPVHLNAIGQVEQIDNVECPMAERERQAGVYLAAVSGTEEGKGADRNCTALTMKMLYGFALPDDTVLSMLSEWGQRTDQLDKFGNWYPWTVEEIDRKIGWSLRQEYDGEIGDRLHAVRELGQLEAKVDGIVEPLDVPTDNVDTKPIVIDPKDQLATATKFFDFEFNGDTLAHHQGCWYRWNDKHYKVVTDDDIKARLWRWLGRCWCWTKPTKEEPSKLKPFQPTRNVVSGILDALKAVSNQSSSVEMPCWFNGSSNPNFVIAFDNGLLDVESYLSGDVSSDTTKLLDHTPNWFSTNCLPHRFDLEGTCPEWFRFLEQVFDGDEERITALQQWFGYNLINDNRQTQVGPVDWTSPKRQRNHHGGDV